MWGNETSCVSNYGENKIEATAYRFLWRLWSESNDQWVLTSANFTLTGAKTGRGNNIKL